MPKTPTTLPPHLHTEVDVSALSCPEHLLFFILFTLQLPFASLAAVLTCHYVSFKCI